MQFQLLLNFNMISHFGLVVLQLSLVLFRRQIYGVEGRCKLRSPSIVLAEPSVCVFVSTRSFSVLIFLKPELHEILKLSLDVCKDSETAQVPESAPLVGEFLGFNHINL